MEVSPHIFESITHFSISNVKKYHPYFDIIKELTIEIESRIQGKHSLVLFKPFPPLGRPGDRLRVLESLCEKDIESIRAFPRRDDEKSARIEIRFKEDTTTIFVKCDQVQGLPCLDKIRINPLEDC